MVRGRRRVAPHLGTAGFVGRVVPLLPINEGQRKLGNGSFVTGWASMCSGSIGLLGSVMNWSGHLTSNKRREIVDVVGSWHSIRCLELYTVLSSQSINEGARVLSIIQFLSHAGYNTLTPISL